MKANGEWKEIAPEFRPKGKRGPDPAQREAVRWQVGAALAAGDEPAFSGRTVPGAGEAAAIPSNAGGGFGHVLVFA